ncbi:alpha-2-macroglobulin family protein [Megalodesulfovibrio paquesii]
MASHVSGERYRSTVKNILLVVLSVVVVVQAVWLWRLSGQVVSDAAANATLAQAAGNATNSTNATGAANASEPVEVANVSWDREHQRFLLIAFDKPIGQDKIGPVSGVLPVTLSPGRDGQWFWISPYVLRFEPSWAFDRNTLYTIRFNTVALLPPGMTLQGPEALSFHVNRFTVRAMSIKEERAPGNASQVMLEGHLQLSESVRPEALLEKFSLADETGATYPISLQENQRTSSWIPFLAGPFPKSKTPMRYTFTLAQGLRQESGTLELEAPYQKDVTVQLDPHLEYKSYDTRAQSGQSSIILHFSAPVDMGSARDFLEVTPAVPFSVTTWDNMLLLHGKFEPGQSYHIVMAQGLRGRDGSLLPQLRLADVRMPDLGPTLDFEGKGLFLSKAGFRTLRLKSTNVESARLSVDRVYPNNLHLLVYSLYSQELLDTAFDGAPISSYLGDKLQEKQLVFPKEKNAEHMTTLPLDELIAQGETGLFRVAVDSNEDYERYYHGRRTSAQRWVLMTDIGLVAKKGVDELLVSAASLDSLAPLAGVKMTLLSHQNQPLASGVTDADGLWKAPLDKTRLEKHRPYLLVAEKGEDFSFLLFDQFRIDQTGQDVGGQAVAGAGYTAYLYGERDLYRPGETAHGVVLLRDDDLNAPPAMPVKLLHKNPRGQELTAMVTSSDERGVATFDIDIPPFAPTGRYLVTCQVGGKTVGEYSYQVEEFLPDRIKVEVQPDEREPVPGEDLAFAVDARYLFGPPASALPAEATVRLRAVPFVAKGYPEYRFNNPELQFEEHEIFHQEGKLDDNGRLALRASLPAGLHPPSLLQAEISARVREFGGRGVAAMAVRTVHAYSRYVGLKQLPRTGVEPGEPMIFDFVLVNPDGTPTNSTTALKAVIVRDQWQTIMRRTPSGSFRYESERQGMPLATLEVDASSGQGSFVWTPPHFGNYRVVLTDEAGGASTQLSFYAGGWGYSPWAVRNPAALELVPDKAEYQPGDMATIQIRAPFDGEGRLLVTLERGRVLDLQVHAMQGNTATVSFPVTEAYSPNVYVGAILVRKASDTEPGMVARAAGWTPLNVSRETNRPAITLTTPEITRPQQGLTVEAVTDPFAVVTLAVVDEGILQLINQKTPAPFEHFYAKRALELDSYDTFAMLLPEIDPTEGRSPAGGDNGHEGHYVRSESLRRVKPVRFWSGPLVADAQGKVTWNIDVPMFNGALRVMAVAANGKRFGSTEAFIKVREPVIVSGTFPRFLSFNETVQIPVTVRNDVDQDAEFEVALHLDGPARLEPGPEQARQIVTVPQGREGLVYFTLRTGEAEGLLSATATATTQNGTQVVSGRDAAEFGVRSPLPPIRVAQTGGLSRAQAGSLVIPPPAGREFVNGTTVREVHVSRLPMLRHAPALKYLLGYPYGCVEQTTSKAFPLLYFGDLAAALEPDLFQARNARAMVQQGIDRIATMQTEDGGFAMWPEGQSTWPWGTLRATHFLVEARAAGYTVHESMLNNALNYLARGLKERSSDFTHKAMAYAAFILAKAGKADKGSMDYLMGTGYFEYESEGASLLAAAYALTGDRQTLEKLMKNQWEDAFYDRHTGGELDSSIGNLALRLLVLQEALPGDSRVAGLVQLLLQHMERARYMNTQESCFAFLALGAFFHAQQSGEPASGALYLGREKIATFSDQQPLSLAGDKAIRSDLPLTLALDPGPTPKGNGTAFFYTVITRGTPVPASHTPLAKGLEVRREFLSRSGEPVAMHGLTQGDVVVMHTALRGWSDVENVVVNNLLPAGLEVENPRLASSERLSWVEKAAPAAYQDIRDDRIVTVLDMQYDEWVHSYSVLRAVTPGEFLAPPVQAEAMYDPEIQALGVLSTVTVLPAGEANATAPPPDEAPSPPAPDNATAVSPAPDEAG